MTGRVAKFLQEIAGFPHGLTPCGDFYYCLRDAVVFLDYETDEFLVSSRSIEKELEMKKLFRFISQGRDPENISFDDIKVSPYEVDEYKRINSCF